MKRPKATRRRRGVTYFQRKSLQGASNSQIELFHLWFIKVEVWFEIFPYYMYEVLMMMICFLSKTFNPKKTSKQFSSKSTTWFWKQPLHFKYKTHVVFWTIHTCFPIFSRLNILVDSHNMKLFRSWSEMKPSTWQLNFVWWQRFGCTKIQPHCEVEHGL